MATTMKLIAKQTLASNAASVSFSSIPGTYTDLLLVCSARLTYSQPIGYYFLALNGSTSSMSVRVLSGNGSTAASRTGTSEVPFAGNTSTASTFSATEIYFPNYAGSTNKAMSITSVIENNASSGWCEAQAQLWSNTAAITSITLQDGYYGGVNFMTGSSFFLYGITKA